MNMPENLPTLEQLHASLWIDIRAHRGALMSQVDIKINKLEDNGQDALVWRQYRQQLRDLPQTTDDPTKVVWPTRPE